MLKLVTDYIVDSNNESIIKKYQKQVNKVLSNISSNKAKGLDFIGWTKKENVFDLSQIKKMENVAKTLKKEKITNLVIIGIGGSYLGIKAAYDMLKPTLDNKTNVYFIHNIHNNYLLSTFDLLKNQKYAIVIISKSGNTLEPAIAFDLFRDNLIKKYGKNANKYIIAITNKQKGSLCQLANKNNWTKFIVPDNIGGRYSALSPVGMLPMILFGFNYKQIIKGYDDAAKMFSTNDLKTNPAFLYACYRHFFFKKKKYTIENFIVYDPSLELCAKTWQQLFGESEGKDKVGMFPTISLFTTDLHSLGQFLQEGTRSFIETTLFIKNLKNDLVFKKANDSNLNYLNNLKLSYVNEVAMTSTVKAHCLDGKVNNFIIELDKQDEYHFALLYMFFCYSAMMSAYLLNLNPFDQPGVEFYKKRINDILKK